MVKKEGRQTIDKETMGEGVKQGHERFGMESRNIWQYGHLESSRTEKEFGRPREARKTDEGNYLICDTYQNRVLLVDPEKNTVFEYDTVTGSDPMGALKLDSGNFLIFEAGGLVEITRDAEVVWKYTAKDGVYPGDVMANGNYLFPYGKTHIAELDPDTKSIVWELNTDDDPDLDWVRYAIELRSRPGMDDTWAGNIVIADWAANVVKEYDKEKNILHQLGQLNTQSHAAMNLFNIPECLDQKAGLHQVLVSDTSKIQLWDIGPPQGPYVAWQCGSYGLRGVPFPGMMGDTAYVHFTPEDNAHLIISYFHGNCVREVRTHKWEPEVYPVAWDGKTIPANETITQGVWARNMSDLVLALTTAGNVDVEIEWYPSIGWGSSLYTTTVGTDVTDVHTSYRVPSPAAYIKITDKTGSQNSVTGSAKAI